MKRRILLALLAIVILIQFIPVSKTNPPVTGDLVATEPAKGIFRRACYDCHSNETVWPWYSHVAPVSWLLSSDVTGGRKKMNFSEWQQMSPEKRQERHHDIWKEVGGGDMPPWFYIPLHPPSKLSAADKTAIKAWSLERTP